MSVQVDSRAVVSSKARLGEGVTVGPFSVIHDDVIIGDGTSIGSSVVVFDGARIGKECKIFHGASISAPPQDLKYAGEPTILEVGDKTVVREFVTLNRATAESGITKIGKNGLFMAYAHVGHDSHLGDNVILANCVALGGHVEIGDSAIVGGLTPVHQFSHIGEHAMIGGGFRVAKDVPPYVLAGQEPLSFERLNIIGLRRRGFDEKTISSLDLAYRLIYNSGLNVSQAVARIKAEVDQTEAVQKVLAFIAGSKRGIIPGRSRPRN